MVTTEGGARPPIEIQMIADVACPWCYLGLVRLERARALRPSLPTALRWWPYLLNPQLPSEGMDRQTYLRAKFGSDAGARGVHQRLETAAAADGIPLALERIRRTPNSSLAQRLILQAEASGRGEAVIQALFRAFYLDGRDIGNRSELLAIGQAAGLDSDELVRLLGGNGHALAISRSNQRAEAMGVRGVPVFIMAGRHAIAGAQPPEVLAGLLDVAALEPAAAPAATPAPVLV